MKTLSKKSFKRKHITYLVILTAVLLSRSLSAVETKYWFNIGPGSNCPFHSIKNYNTAFPSKEEIKQALEKGENYHLRSYEQGKCYALHWEYQSESSKKYPFDNNILFESMMEGACTTEFILLCASAPECSFDPKYKDPDCPIRINHDDPLLLSSASNKPWYIQKFKRALDKIPEDSTKDWYLGAGNQGLTWYEEKKGNFFRDIIILAENNKVEGLGAQLQANDITLKNNTAQQEDKNADNDDVKNQPNSPITNKDEKADNNQGLKIAGFCIAGGLVVIGIYYYYASKPNEKRHSLKNKPKIKGLNQIKNHYK